MKTTTVKPVPEGYHTVSPYLIVNGAADLISFLEKTFNAKEKLKFASSDGKRINHAEMKLGDSIIMLADSTKKIKPMPAMIHLYLKDTDGAYKRALKAGAISLREPSNQVHGDRSAGVKDPWGNQWWISTHIEDLTPREMMKRREAHRNKTRSTS